MRAAMQSAIRRELAMMVNEGSTLQPMGKKLELGDVEVVEPARPAVPVKN